MRHHVGDLRSLRIKTRTGDDEIHVSDSECITTSADYGIRICDTTRVRMQLGRVLSLNSEG